MQKKTQRGFTLVEMLVVMGIIAVLIGAGLTGYNAAIAKAQTAKAVELVHEVATALGQVYQKDNAWPRSIISEGTKTGGQLNEQVGGILAKRGALSLDYRAVEQDGVKHYVLTGINKFGLVSPWAAEVVKKRIKTGQLSLTTKVPTGGTIEDHRLRFAIDDDGDGRVDVGGDGLANEKIRASFCVWCAGRDGKFGTKDDVKSWSEGQVIR